jgi:hypothetical protein
MSVTTEGTKSAKRRARSTRLPGGNRWAWLATMAAIAVPLMLIISGNASAYTRFWWDNPSYAPGCSSSPATGGVTTLNASVSGSMSFYTPSTVNGTGTFQASVRSSTSGSQQEAGFEYMAVACDYIGPQTGHLVAFFNVSGSDIFSSSCNPGSVATGSSNVSAIMYLYDKPSTPVRLGTTTQSVWSDSPAACTTTTVNHGVTKVVLTSGSISLVTSAYFDVHVFVYAQAKASASKGAGMSVDDVVWWNASGVDLGS